MQRKLSELSSKHKISISSAGKKVEAPLPPDFGFTVGSEYSTPFDVGTLSGNLAKAYAVAEISNPVGLRMRKMYTNPEPTELSFDMEFAAYYSAKEEVVVPIITLICMGLGRVTRNEDIERMIERFGRAAAKGVSLIGLETDAPSEYVEDAKETINQDGVREKTTKLLDLIQLITAPEICTLKFGEFLIIDNVFITSTAVQFSNVLDKDGYPLSGTVSVTCTLQVAPVADDIINMFGGVTSI